MATLEKVYWYNNPKTVNDNFEAVNDELAEIQEEIEAIEGSAVTEAAAVTNISGTNLPAVPALVDTAAVKTYLDSLVPATETRADNIELKINDLLTKLRASGAIAD